MADLLPAWQALAATSFTWGVTAAGAAVVIVFRRVNERLLRTMLGFAAGVMIAASFRSLLLPAIEMAEELGKTPWGPALIGFLGGALFIWTADKVLPHLHPGMPIDRAEGPRTRLGKSALLVLAITLHNGRHGGGRAAADGRHDAHEGVVLDVALS